MKVSIDFQQEVDIAIFDALHFRHNHTRYTLYLVQWCIVVYCNFAVMRANYC